MARFELTESDRAAIVSGVSCALLLERAGYSLDKTESTRNCLKYRRSKGETIIVKFDGRGWWDPGFAATDHDGKGDVFDLLRRLQPDLSFRDVCVTLGGLVGVEPDGAVFVRERKASAVSRAPAERWAEKREPRYNGKVWTYLTAERCLPAWVIRRAIAAGVLRDGYHAAWFAHTLGDGSVCGAELRGPATHLCLSGSIKTLFRFRPQDGGDVTRLVVCESAIDALSCAALDTERTPDTMYVSTAGGMGPETIEALTADLAAMSRLPGAVLVVATDDDTQGDRFADHLYEMAAQTGVEATRILPPDRAKDFNQTLKNLAARVAA